MIRNKHGFKTQEVKLGQQQQDMRYQSRELVQQSVIVTRHKHTVILYITP